MVEVEDIKERFQSLRGAAPRVFRAPGRVNLIGEHTDYNDGFVLPAAIDFYSQVAIGPAQAKTIHALSENFQEAAEFNLDSMNTASTKSWIDYVRGVAIMLQGAGCQLGGAELLIESNVP